MSDKGCKVSLSAEFNAYVLQRDLGCGFLLDFSNGEERKRGEEGKYSPERAQYNTEHNLLSFFACFLF